MVELKESMTSLLLLAILVVASVPIVVYVTWPGYPSVDVKVTNNGRLVRNITISCFQCVPVGREVWNGSLKISGLPVNPSSVSFSVGGSSAGSTATWFYFALAAQVPKESVCNGYTFNSTCILPVNLPLSVSFHLQRLSSVGTFQVVLYLEDGEWFKFPASGGIGAVFNFVSS